MMANAKSRIKAPSKKISAPRNKRKGRKYSNLKEVNKAKDSKVKSKLPHNVISDDTFPESSEHNIAVKQKSTSTVTRRSLRISKESLITRNGRIKKKNIKKLKLIDNILKSELMIVEDKKPLSNIIANEEKPKNAIKGENNNDDRISDQNQQRYTFGRDKNKKHEKKSKKPITRKNKVKTKKPKTSDLTKLKQVTLSNGLVLTLRLFQCDYCKKTFTCKSSLRRHIYVHLNIKPFCCSKCPKKYRQKCNLLGHIKKDHPASWENKEPETFICDKCDKPFLLKENLTLHLISHVKNENSFKCAFCNRKFSHHLLLMQHEKQHLIPGKYTCSICKISYECRSRLMFHIKSHLKIKDFVCQYCGKEFLRPNSIKRHVQICHTGHRIRCPICNKELKGHLTEHMRTHENKRPHECSDCGQRFTQATQLTVHRRSHTGARPYDCRICGRAFSHSNALMLHKRRHTGEKPFACAMCPLSFSQLPHMKAHMRKIHGKENPYKCAKCGQFFKLKVGLENHVKICTVGDKELTFEEKIQASVQYEDIEVESVMSLSRMRFLLALLLTMIATKEKLKYLGFNKRLIDDLLVESLEAMGQYPCRDTSLAPLGRLKTNIDILLRATVPDDQMEKFRSENKTTEELLELLTNEKKKES